MIAKHSKHLELFRPCIDLHEGKVKQIVGDSLHSSNSTKKVKENYVANQEVDYFVDMYALHGFSDGHIIMLDKSSSTKDCVRRALNKHPNAYHVGGGVNLDNATDWLAAGAKKIIVSSYIFEQNQFSLSRLKKISSAVGKENLVIDLSTVKSNNQYHVSIHKWKTITNFTLTKKNLQIISKYADELLIHAIDREGKKKGADFDLINELHRDSLLPVVYAGGIASVKEIDTFLKITNRQMGFTIGSSLDIFGGSILLAEVIDELSKH